MSPPFLIGKRLYLRPLTEADLNQTYLNWLNDLETTRYLFTGRFPIALPDLQSYWRKFQGSQTNLLFAIVLHETDRHIGNVTLNNINWVHRLGDTGIMLGAKDCWGQGYAGEAWRLVIGYGFQRLGLNKIFAGAVDMNKASIATLKKLGFKEEGILRQEFYLDGVYHDVVRLGILRDEFHLREK